MGKPASLARADARFVKTLIDTHNLGCDDPDCNGPSPADVLTSFASSDDDSGETKPAVKGGRIVRIELHYDEPKVIDLRGLEALEEVYIYGQESNAALVLGSHPRLVHLKYEFESSGDIQRAAIDLRGCTALREAHFAGANIKGLRGVPASLRVLHCSDNPLETLDLASATGLEQLHVDGCGLTSLDLKKQKALKELWIQGNAITSIDLRAQTKLRELIAPNLPLTTLDVRHMSSLDTLTAGSTERRLHVQLPRTSSLKSLRLTGSDVSSFDTRSHPRLEMLYLENGTLSELHLEHATLHWLNIVGNRVDKLDLSRVPSIKCLELADNPIAHLDVTKLAKLTRDKNWVSFPEDAEIVCTELQRNTVPALCERAGLTKPTKTLGKMNGFLLHDWVREYNWDSGPKKLLEVVRHPRCDLATALYIYWLTEPGEYVHHRRAADVTDRTEKSWVELLREIEAKVAKGKYPSGSIPFDVTDIDGTDFSEDDARIPKIMRKPIRVPKGGAVVLAPKKARKKRR